MKLLLVASAFLMISPTAQAGTITFSNGTDFVDLNYTTLDIGGGLIRHDFFLDDPANASASYFLQSLGFSGKIVQNLAFGILAVDSSVQAATFNVTPGAGYNSATDSFFFSPFTENTAAPGITDSAGAGLLQRTYSVNAGSGGGSQLDLVQIAQIITSSEVLVAGSIGRSGKTFIGSGTIPVPEPSTLTLLGMATIGIMGYVVRRRLFIRC